MVTNSKGVSALYGSLPRFKPLPVYVMVDSLTNAKGRSNTRFSSNGNEAQGCFQCTALLGRIRQGSVQKSGRKKVYFKIAFKFNLVIIQKTKQKKDKRKGSRPKDIRRKCTRLYFGFRLKKEKFKNFFEKRTHKEAIAIRS